MALLATSNRQVAGRAFFFKIIHHRDIFILHNFHFYCLLQNIENILSSKYPAASAFLESSLRHVNC